MREDQINSAVTFLREPQVISAALAEKVRFLESKGLTTEEINEALKRSQEETSGGDAASTTTTSTAPSVPKATIPQERIPPRPSYMMQTPPPLPERDWKDYFVMATVSVGVAYGLYECARRYVLPMIMPPTPAALEADKEALEAEFERTEQLVKQLQEDTAELKEQEKLRTIEFKRVMGEAHSLIEHIKDQNDDRRQESKLALSNVETLRDMIPSALKEHSETQVRAIEEVRTELKSLKQLLSRRQNSQTPLVPPASSVPSSLPGFPRKPKASSETPKTENKTDTRETEKTSSSKPEEPAKEETAKDTTKSSEGNGTSDDKNNDTGSSQDAFIPDPQSGIPEWQRAAMSS